MNTILWNAVTSPETPLNRFAMVTKSEKGVDFWRAIRIRFELVGPGFQLTHSEKIVAGHFTSCLSLAAL